MESKFIKETLKFSLCSIASQYILTETGTKDRIFKYIYIRPMDVAKGEGGKFLQKPKKIVVEK